MLSQEQQMELWDPGWWIKEGQDLGILIVDKTDVNTRAWDSSAISQVGGTVKAGNNASTITFMDDDYYNVRQQSGYNFNMVVTPIIDGIVVADTDFLKHIEIQYSFRLRVYTVLAKINATIYFEILKDTEWLPIAQVSHSRFNGGHTTSWVMGIPIGEYPGSTGNPYKAPDDTDVELRKYFNKDNGNYSSLKGLRFRISGVRGTTGIPYGDIRVDYIKVKVGYTSDDISPIMETITNNAASTITCADVSAWDETGVVENDGFRIGQNTRAILQDISTQSGLEINIIDNYGNTSLSPHVYPNGDGGTITWATTGGDHFGELDDGNDATYVSAFTNMRYDEYTFGDINLLGGYVSQIVIKARCMRSVHEALTLYFSYSEDGGTSYSSEESEALINAWQWQTAVWSSLEIYDLDDFQIKMRSPTFGAGGTAYCSEIYVIFTISGSSFSKYMAREFKGSRCIEPLKAVCKLEGAKWYEDYINDKIVVVKPADLVDSGVDLTEADYDGPWEYEDICNQVKSFYVFGKSEDNIFAKAVDETINSYISEQLIDESITNVADAQEIADAQLALVNSKRPSIKLPLTVDNVALQLGTTVDVTFARPTIAKAAYPIRKLERKRRGIDDIALTIWVGLGESTMEENVIKFIRDNMFRSHKALTDRLISP